MNQITEEQAQEIVDACSSEIEYRSYTGRGMYREGRGMYSEECLAFTADRDTDAACFAGHLALALDYVLGMEKAEQMMGQVTSDGMGLGTVLYFRGYELVEDEEEEG